MTKRCTEDPHWCSLIKVGLKGGCHLGRAHSILGSWHGHRPNARTTMTAREGWFRRYRSLVRANFCNWGKCGARCSSARWPRWERGIRKTVRWPNGRGEADCGIGCRHKQVIKGAGEGAFVAASGIVDEFVDEFVKFHQQHVDGVKHLGLCYEQRSDARRLAVRVVESAVVVVRNNDGGIGRSGGGCCGRQRWGCRRDIFRRSGLCRRSRVQQWSFGWWYRLACWRRLEFGIALPHSIDCCSNCSKLRLIIKGRCVPFQSGWGQRRVVCCVNAIVEVINDGVRWISSKSPGRNFL